MPRSVPASRPESSAPSGHRSSVLRVISRACKFFPIVELIPAILPIPAPSTSGFPSYANYSHTYSHTSMFLRTCCSLCLEHTSDLLASPPRVPVPFPSSVWVRSQILQLLAPPRLCSITVPPLEAGIHSFPASSLGCELPEGKSHIWHLAGNLALAHFQRRADKDSAAEPRVPGN